MPKKSNEYSAESISVFSNLEDTKKLIQIIKPFIMKSMKHKIGEKNE